MVQSNPFRFFGCANPRGKPNTYNGFELTEKDASIAAEQLVGKPVLIEHEGNSVGEVEAAWVGQDGRLMVLGKTFDKGARARYARNMVIDGELGELSLGSTASVNMDNFNVDNKQMVEISLVEKGLRDGTIIENKTRTERPSYKDAIKVALTCSAKETTPMQPSSAQDTSQEKAEAPPVAPEAAAPAPEETAPGPDASVPTESVTQAPAQTQPVAQQQQQPENNLATMSNEELMARVAALTQTNKWLQDKAKRSYTAAFDAAAEEFLNNLKVEDAAGKQGLIQSLKQMTTNPHFAGPEGNAVMEVVCAASKQNSELQRKVEAQMEQLKKQKSDAAAQQAARINNPKKPTVPSNNFNAKSNREASPTGAPPRVDKRQPAPRSYQPVGMQDSQPSMFNWLASGQKSAQGMEQMNYSSLKNRDFSLRAAPTAYNGIP